jgi:hypothetical protein
MLIYLQLRANWNFILPQCQELNSQSSKPNIIVLFITDVVLLLIVLVGLFRLRSQGHLTCGIGRLLWKQVREISFPLVVVLSVK